MLRVKQCLVLLFLLLLLIHIVIFFYKSSVDLKCQFDINCELDDPREKSSEDGRDKNATQEFCRWPPHRPEDIVVHGAYNVTLCVKASENGLEADRPKKYPLNQLFHTALGNAYVTFEQMSALPRKMWSKMFMPEVYRIYPQDVPMWKIIGEVKNGRNVTEVSLFKMTVIVTKTSPV